MTDRIRQVTMEDLDRVTEVEALCFPPAEAADRQAFEEPQVSGQFFRGGKGRTDHRIYQRGSD